MRYLFTVCVAMVSVTDVRHHPCFNRSGRVTSPSCVLNIVYMKLVSFVQIIFTTYRLRLMMGCVSDKNERHVSFL